MLEVFISYRESDAKFAAVVLRDEFVAAFGEEAVFLDKDSLRSGEWSQQLEAAIRGCRAFVLVMGSRWLSATDREGRLRLEDARDVHRCEIELALSLPTIRVIPVLVDGISMPRSDQLPATLTGLQSRQAFLLSDIAKRRVVDLARLTQEVCRTSGLKDRRPPPKRIPESIARLARTAAWALVFTIALGVVAHYRQWYWLGDHRLKVVLFSWLTMFVLDGMRRPKHGSVSKSP